MATSRPYLHAGITELSLSKEELAHLFSFLPEKVTVFMEGVCEIYIHKHWSLFYNTATGHGWLNHTSFIPWSVPEYEKRLERERNK